MRILVAAIGRLKQGPERDLAARYAERAAQAGRAVALGPLEFREIAESRAKRPEDRKREEGEALRALFDDRSPLVLLEETGTALSSADFAARLGRLRDEGASLLQFAIGGANGLDADLRARAALTMSFGRLTLPHQLVRVLLAEQIYRAATILAGHPYHRE
jgi:23S rRNA (pseudouridine1915-N3)-methyltransferase